MRRAVTLVLAVAVFAVSAACPASADRDTVYVPGSLDLTIQDGLDLAVGMGPGTIVEVAPGTYSTATGETFPIIMRSGIVLRSASGPSSTIIDGNDVSRIISCVNMGAGTAIEGFTLLDGRHSSEGGAVQCVNATVDFLDCEFEGNEATYAGGGLYCEGTSSITMTECEFRQNEAWSDIDSGGGAISAGSGTTLVLTDCLFDDNWAFISGGALSLGADSATITGCQFLGNSSYLGGAIRSSADVLTLTSCTFAENYAHTFEYFSGSGGAVYLGSGDVLIEGCTFAYNQAQDGYTSDGKGGAIYCYPNAYPTLANTIIAFCTNGEAFYWGPPVAVTCCDVYGNADGPGALAPFIGINNNIAQDPLFCGGTIPYPYRLDPNSPCAEENNAACGQIGAWPSGCTFVAWIEIYIEWIEYVIGPDDVLCQPFQFANTGELDLMWDLSVMQDIPSKRESGAESEVSSADAGEPASVEVPSNSKAAKNERQPTGEPSPSRGSGGPDEFGYIWMDSDEPGGPTFDWYDIQSVGWEMQLGDDDYGYVQLPNTIPFYGNQKFDIFISSNGYLTFGWPADEYWNEPIPSSVAPNDVIAPFWDDLDPSAGGTVHYYYHWNLNAVIVQWTDVPHYAGSGTGEYTFQALVYADGTIVYQYLEMQGDLDSASIGIEDPDGTVGLEVAYNEPYVHDELAVRIEVGELPYITAFPTSGVLMPDGVQEVDVCVSSSSLEPWNVYDGALLLVSNAQNNPELMVPINVWVYPTGVEQELLPEELVLHGAVPNPFNPRTEIRFGLPQPADVSLRVYDAAGRLVRVLADDLAQQPGAHSIPWDGRDDGGRPVASGVYFCRLEANGEMLSGKMLLLK